jgi:RNA polymerase sigma-70 factor, ECF subfamily
MPHGPAAGLAIVESRAATDHLPGYHLLPAVRADLLRRLHRSEDAARYYGEALSLATTESERRFLSEGWLRRPPPNEGIGRSARTFTM